MSLALTSPSNSFMSTAQYTPLAVDDNNQSAAPAQRVSSSTRRSILWGLILVILVAVGYKAANHYTPQPDLDHPPNNDEKEMSGKLNVA